MVTLVPVSSDPFAAAPPPSAAPQPQPKLVPVHGDPFKVSAPIDRGDEIGGALYQGITFGYGDEIDGAIASALYGKEYGQKVTDTERQSQAQFHKDHPVAAAAINLGGGLLTPGVGVLGKAVSKIPSAAGRLLGSTGLGAGMGALAGSGEAESGGRLKGARVGAVAGAAGGATLHGLGVAGRAIDEATGGRITASTEWLVDQGRKLVGLSTAPRTPIAVRNAAQRLKEAIDDDRVTPQHIAAVRKERASHGLPNPSLAQVGDQNVEAVLRHASSKMGEGRSASVAERRATREGLAARGREHVDQAIPVKSPVGIDVKFPDTGDVYKDPSNQPVRESSKETAERLAKEQSRDAETKFRQPYAQPIDLTHPLMETLSSTEAEKAMSAAERTANERVGSAEAKQQATEISALRKYRRDLMDYQAKHAEWQRSGGYDLSKLTPEQRELLEEGKLHPDARTKYLEAIGAHPEPEPPPLDPPHVSAGAIDRIRISLRDRADALTNEPGGEHKITHSMGVAIKGREKALDDYLDGVPGLEEARGSYKAKQQAIEAAQFKGKILDQTPRDFRRYVDGLPPEAKALLKTVTHDELFKALGTPREAQSILEKLATDQDSHDNLVTLLGQDDADRLTRAAHLRLDDLRKATRIAPDTNSQTFSREQDNKKISSLWFHLSSPQGALHRLVSLSLQNGQLHMSKEEASALEQLGRGNPDKVLDLIKKNPSSPISQMAKMVAGREAGQEAGQQNESERVNMNSRLDTLMRGDQDKMWQQPSGAPSTPPSVAQPDVSLKPDVDSLSAKIAVAEGFGNNPSSSAKGWGQFTDPTFVEAYKAAFPQQAAGMSSQQILAQRGTGVEVQMLPKFTEKNISALKAAGIPPTAGNVYLAHFLGSSGAISVLSQTPDTSVEDILPDLVVRSNPFLKGMTVDDLAQWAEGKMA